MFKLVELGFIKSQQEGNREFGQVLLLNPITVCAKLRSEGKVAAEWWASFLRRAGEIKATIPEPPVFPPAPPPRNRPTTTS